MPWTERPYIADISVDPVPPSEREQRDDQAYANDFATLVAIFRTNIAEPSIAASPAGKFAGQLARLRSLILDGWGSPDAGFLQQCMDDHGPQSLLRALAKAYEQPEHVLGQLEGD
jgi:hypothetical protein